MHQSRQELSDLLLFISPSNIPRAPDHSTASNTAGEIRTNRISAPQFFQQRAKEGKKFAVGLLPAGLGGRKGDTANSCLDIQSIGETGVQREHPKITFSRPSRRTRTLLSARCQQPQGTLQQSLVVETIVVFAAGKGTSWHFNPQLAESNL